MKAIRSTLTRLLLVFIVCTMVFVSQAMPANAKQSSPYKGEDQLLGIEKESQKIIQSGEPSPQNKEAKQKTSGGGLNAIQGTADAEKMNRPENSEGKTVEEELGEALNDIKK